MDSLREHSFVNSIGCLKKEYLINVFGINEIFVAKIPCLIDFKIDSLDLMN